MEDAVSTFSEVLSRNPIRRQHILAHPLVFPSWCGILTYIVRILHFLFTTVSGLASKLRERAGPWRSLRSWYVVLRPSATLPGVGFNRNLSRPFIPAHTLLPSPPCPQPTQRAAQESAYEADLQRNPFSLKNWLYYLNFKAEASPADRYDIYERALGNIPRSYKLWQRYLDERSAECDLLPLSHPRHGETQDAFERALIHMNKMPVIWRMFLDFATKQKWVTATRRSFDRALCALPVTQHVKFVWPAYLAFAQGCGVPETAMRVWRRYIKVSPRSREDYIASLLAADRVDEAARQLAAVIDDESFVSQKGRSKHDLWTELLQLLVRHAREVTSVDVDAVVRSGIRKYPHEVGRLWTALADYYQRMGLMERARDVYVEALDAVLTVRDFEQVFRAYGQFEDGLISAKEEQAALLEAAANADVAAAAKAAGPGARPLSVAAAREGLEDANAELDLRMLRLEKLAAGRDLLRNSVHLRQNPHNVDTWLERVRFCGEDALRVVRPTPRPSQPSIHKRP